MIIDLPLPDKLLHPNARPHYMQKARLVRQHRDHAQFIARTHKDRKTFTKPVVSMDFHLSRKRDVDGLVAWIKSYLDGFEDAGLFENDSAVEIGQVKRHKAKVAKVVFTITEGEQ